MRFVVFINFLFSKNMDQGICIKFCMKNKIRSLKVHEIWNKIRFINGSSSSKRAEMNLKTKVALDTSAHQQSMKTLKQWGNLFGKSFAHAIQKVLGIKRAVAQLVPKLLNFHQNNDYDVETKFPSSQWKRQEEPTSVKCEGFAHSFLQI